MKKLTNIDKRKLNAGSFFGLAIFGLVTSIIGAVSYTVVNAVNTAKVRNKLDEEQAKQVYYNKPLKTTFTL